MKTCIFVLLLLNMIWKVTPECDDSTDAMVQEGNHGQSALFSWLGVLRVRIHKGGEVPRVAVTGLVLIRKRYALVSADDVIKIPRDAFKEDSRVMFMASTDTPWFCVPKSYKTHHEYEYMTMNTIAVLELNLDDVSGYPMRPICFTNKMSFNISTFLYVTGYTDENKLLEKVIYKVQYTDKQVCEDFYNRSGLTDGQNKPVHYLCGYSTFHRQMCAWENGMALVSNATQYFTLIGFAVHGPSCSAPARFIEVQRYYDWIAESTSLFQAEIYDEYAP